jgi:hypothetical protein
MYPCIPTLFVGWFCPFAQRTWITFEYFKQLENLSFSLVNSEGSIVLDEDYHFMLKGHRLIDATPKDSSSVVPFVIWNENSVDELKPYHDSILLSSIRRPFHATFLPIHALEQSRSWSDAICTKHFYGALKPPPFDHASAFQQLCDNMDSFAKSLQGRFYYGDSFSLVDATVIPFLWRALNLDIFNVYRQHNLNSQSFAPKLRDYVAACLELPFVRATLPLDTDEITFFSASLLRVYRVYAEGAGLRSLVPMQDGDEKDESEQLPEGWKFPAK